MTHWAEQDNRHPVEGSKQQFYDLVSRFEARDGSIAVDGKSYQAAVQGKCSLLVRVTHQGIHADQPYTEHNYMSFPPDFLGEYLGASLQNQPLPEEAQPLMLAAPQKTYFQANGSR